MEGRPRSQPDDLINFRQLRSNALQAAELDIYDGDDIRSAISVSGLVDFLVLGLDFGGFSGLGFGFGIGFWWIFRS